MSTPAPVTEAHRQAAVSIFELAMKSSHHGAPFREPCAQLIANSEAKATAELRGALALGQQNCDDVYDDLRTERDAAIARAERAEAELAAERARLKEMAAELAHCAGYIASVRTDRQITWHEELYALQTVEWAEGAVEIAEKANAVLESHDAAMKERAT